MFFCRFLLDQLKQIFLKKMEFQNQNLILKEFEYKITLRGLLKEEYEIFNINEKRCFLIKTEKFLEFFKDYQRKIFDDYGVVCESVKNCVAHEAYFYLKYLKDELINSVENEKRYYKAFYFQLTNTPTVAFGGWTAEPVQPKCLKHLSYSRRLAYLN